ncbi:hypothetical protein RUM44_007708 [Polyplax serrata]|uniref:Phospholipase B-like n=1 Tax=Polyplax serrata TaxID=468196 RepID=A0ABR1BA93_POLSC
MLKVVGASWMKIRMSTWIIGIVLVLGIIVVILGQMGQLEEDGNYSATAYWNEETGFEIRFWGQGLDIENVPTGVARVYFEPHIDTTGWAIIDIETQSNYPDWVQAYAAGMLEGSLSWQLIYWQWKNTVQDICVNQKLFCNYIKTYLEENLKSIKNSYENRDDPYWHQVYLFYMQLEGMKQGFEHGVKRSRQSIEELQFVDFLWMNAASDVMDLEYKFYDSKPYAVGFNYSGSMLLKKLRSFRSVNGYTNDNSKGRKILPEIQHPHHIEEDKRSFTDCGVNLGSTLVKLLPDEGQLFVGHNTAGPYVSMLRMLKTYHFRFHWSATNFWTVENKLTFSSYPGAIHSMDDFYVISMSEQQPRMIVAGTPITVFTRTLWKLVSPRDQVLSGVRTIVASRLSTNGSAWVKYLSRYNSGTGNKQWIVVDVDRFRNVSRTKENNIGNGIKDVLWVAEQIPGHFVMEDQTKLLRTKTYWASYGLPFYKNISDLSGVNEIRKIFGDAFSYENSPLAKIYRRDHEKAQDLNTMMNLMRSNSYKKDPFSLGNPGCAIGARGDIPTEVSHSFPVGVIDSKVFSVVSSNRTNTTSGAHWEFLAVAGPTHSFYHYNTTENENLDVEVESGNATVRPEVETDDDFLKPFNWAKSVFAGFPHNGHPDVWDFDSVSLPL